MTAIGEDLFLRCGAVGGWWLTRVCCSYRDMFNRVQKAPLNKSQVGAGYEKFLKPLLQQTKWPSLNKPRAAGKVASRL